MLEILPDFNAHYQRKLIQTRDFLQAQGVAEDSYAIIGSGASVPASSRVTMRYGESQFEAGGFLAEIMIDNRVGMVANMEFSLATMVLSYLMDQSDTLEKVLAIDPTASLKEAASALSVDLEAVWHEPGSPLIKEGVLLSYREDPGDYVVAFHERGDVTVRMTSENAAMIAVCCRCEFGIEETDIPSRRAPYMPR